MLLLGPNDDAVDEATASSTRPTRNDLGSAPWTASPPAQDLEQVTEADPPSHHQVHPPIPHGSVSIAAPGTDEAVVLTTPIGTKRSKAGATLTCVLADAAYWRSQFAENDGDGNGLRLLLDDPSVSDVHVAIERVTRHLAQGWRDDGIWGAQFGFAFSGHGERDGTICLSDGQLSVAEILPAIASELHPQATAQLMSRIFLDSCFAGAALCMALESLPPSVSLRDAYGAALHDEEAGEYDVLGHGLLTYAAKHQTPLHVRGQMVDRLLKEGAWAVDSSGAIGPRDEFDYPEDLSDAVRNSLIDFDLVPFLSAGDQHVLDIMNTRSIRVRGRGEIDLASEFGTDAVDAYTLYRRLEDLTRKPLDTGHSTARSRRGRASDED